MKVMSNEGLSSFDAISYASFLHNLSQLRPKSGVFKCTK